MTFYNTTREEGELLEEFKEATTKQETKILEIFETFNNLSPSQVLKFYMNSYQGQMVPLTSIRRAITNLTKDGILIKTTNKREGIFGRKEYIWELKK